VTVVGYAASADVIVTRAGAEPGDIVVVTGSLGGSAHALELIGSAPSDDPRLQKQFAPEPRFAAGKTLARIGATAMIDISDGLARDAGHIASASNVRLTIDLPAIPLADGVESAEFAAASGEEYELLATIPASKFDELRAAFTEVGVELTAIGRVSEGSGADLLDASGRHVDVRGFDHFD
jgi:thiamine-monophosphate kinase